MRRLVFGVLLALSGCMGLGDFPTAPLVVVCGRAPEELPIGPNDDLSSLFERYGSKDVVASTLVCGARTRQQAAVGLTIHASRAHALQELLVASETYHEPMAMSKIGKMYFYGQHLPRDVERGWRMIEAARHLAEISGDLDLYRKVIGNTIAPTLAFDDPELLGLHDPNKDKGGIIAYKLQRELAYIAL